MELSASPTLTRGQRSRLIAAGLAGAAALVIAPLATLTALIAVITAAYLAAFVYRARIFRQSFAANS
jgi:hypothetical protein